jgi:hypothetical protein
MANPPKKKSPKPADFVKTLKVYFSSLTARGAQYLYLNVAEDPNTMVISNGDYELLTSYVPVTLSIHAVRFKDSEFYQKFLDFLGLSTSDPYVIRMPQFLKALRENDFTDLKVSYDTSRKMRLVLKDTIVLADKESDDDDDDEEEEEVVDLEENPFADTSKIEVITFDSLDVCGQPMNDHHALVILENTVDRIVKLGENFGDTEIPHVTKILERDEVNYFTSNYFRVHINLTEFKDGVGNPYYSEEIAKDLYVVLVDGMDVPSMKEFAKRRSGQICLHLWVKDGGTIQHMASYHDEELSIFSMRPFTEVLPIRTKTSEAGD